MDIDSWGATILIRTLFSLYSSYMFKAHFAHYDLFILLRYCGSIFLFLAQVVRAFVCVCVCVCVRVFE